jgi:hypothetical protein
MRDKKPWEAFGEGASRTGWIETAITSDAEVKIYH